jgi:hypothetical protein
MKNRRVQRTTKLNFNVAKVRKKLLNSDDRTARAAGKYLSNTSRLSNQKKQALLELGRLLTKVVELQAARRATRQRLVYRKRRNTLERKRIR